MGKTKTVNKEVKYKIQVKEYSEEYLEAVKCILNENFDNPWTQEQINFTDKFSYKKVYLIDNIVVAFLEAKIVADEAEIFMIAVKKFFQGKGIGKSILNSFFDDMKKLNVKTVFLEVAEDNIPAISLYRGFGFKEYIIRKNYYKNNKDAILMKKDILEFL